MDKISFRRLARYHSDDWLLIETNLAGEWVMANKKGWPFCTCGISQPCFLLIGVEELEGYFPSDVEDGIDVLFFDVAVEGGQVIQGAEDLVGIEICFDGCGVSVFRFVQIGEILQEVSSDVYFVVLDLDDIGIVDSYAVDGIEVILDVDPVIHDEQTFLHLLIEVMVGLL